MKIRPAEPADTSAIGEIIVPTFARLTYALDPDISEAQALGYWLSSEKETFVAEDHGVIAGTYYLRPNQHRGGRHVCNCGYLTRAMCQHSLEHARSRGYRAMQFNFVVTTNERAIRLWQSLGFGIVARVPQAFRHPEHGYVDALVMHRLL